MNAKKVIKELELEVTKCDREMARLSKRAADLERAIKLLGGQRKRVDLKLHAVYRKRA